MVHGRTTRRVNDGASRSGPRLAERMRTLATAADRESILQRIASLTQSDGRLWGKMSAHQMVCHLCDAYRLPLGEKTASPTTGFLPPAIMKWIALQLPLKWPHGVATRPEMEQGVGGTPPAEFERDRADLLLAYSAILQHGHPGSAASVLRRHEQAGVVSLGLPARGPSFAPVRPVRP